MHDQVKEYRIKVLSHIKSELHNNRGRILDVGCGDCGDAAIFTNWGMSSYGIDVFRHKNAQKTHGNKFKKGSILKIPFNDNFFDFVYAKDILHHIDEKKQSLTKHIQGIKEMKRVCKTGGKVIVLEANRYNLLFYPHMVLINKHNHFMQSYFNMLMRTVFLKPKFIFFEAHIYPKKLKAIFKVYEKIMESLVFLRPFLAYNLSIAKKEE